MRKHIKTIGNYHIIIESEWDMDRFYFIVQNGYKDIDIFPTQTQAENFIKECLTCLSI